MILRKLRARSRTRAWWSTPAVEELTLERAIGVRRVDLIILPEANALLAADVVRGELLFARDAAVEAETQLYYLRRAGDLAPFYRERWRTSSGASCDARQGQRRDGHARGVGDGVADASLPSAGWFHG